MISQTRTAPGPPLGPAWAKGLLWALVGPPWALPGLCLGTSWASMRPSPGPLDPWAPCSWTLGPGAAKPIQHPEQPLQQLKKPITTAKTKMTAAIITQTEVTLTPLEVIYGLQEAYVHICVGPHMGPRRLNMGTRRLMYMYGPYMGPICMYVCV